MLNDEDTKKKCRCSLPSSDYTIASARLLLYIPLLQAAFLFCCMKFIALCDSSSMLRWNKMPSMNSYSHTHFSSDVLCCLAAAAHCNESCFICSEVCSNFPFILPKAKLKSSSVKSREREEIIFTINDISTYCVYANILQHSILYANSVHISPAFSDIARGVEIETNEMSELNIEDGKVVKRRRQRWLECLVPESKWHEMKMKWEYVRGGKRTREQKCVLLCCIVCTASDKCKVWFAWFVCRHT